MGKFLFRYKFFWLPAVASAYIFTEFNAHNSPFSQSVPGQVIQWATALIMLIGWSVNTGMCAYFYPRNTFSLLLAYYSVCLILVTVFYQSMSGTMLRNVFGVISGLISYKPLDIISRVIRDFFAMTELVMINILAGCNFIGYVIGFIARRVNPNPYRPKLYRWKKYR
jgi:hypothetical protein